jgi:hypothetical protein
VRRLAQTLALGKWNFCVDCPELERFCACTPDNSAIMAGMGARATCADALGDMLAYVPNARYMHYSKGPHHLEAAIARLRAEGQVIEYVKVQGVPNAEVIRQFGEAGLVADHLIGVAYGFTALEAMARGKPMMTYVRSPNLVEAPEECPLINVTPHTLEATLR